MIGKLTFQYHSIGLTKTKWQESHSFSGGKAKKQTFFYIDLFVLPFKERKYTFSTGQKEVCIINKRNQQMLQAKN